MSTSGPDTRSRGTGQGKEERLYRASHWELMWWQFRRHRLALISAAILGIMYFLAIFADICAPYDKTRRFRGYQDSPPTRIYVYSEEQRRLAMDARASYQKALNAAGRGIITTEILDAPPFYYAEEYHQQYLAKNPNGYCGLGGTGVGYCAGS